MSSNEAINEFNQRVINAHNEHYKNSPSGLIDKSTDASPNGNTIWHLYSDGTITFQKGAWAYGRRSEFTDSYSFNNKGIPFKFVLEAADDTTYAILTNEECKQFREEMVKLLGK